MITVNEAIDLVVRNTGRLRHEMIGLSASVGRILAEDIVADMDIPPFDRSQMDGYAVRSIDTVDAPVELEIVGESAAGRGWHKTLGSGKAVAIMTGAPVPTGADSVQKIELTRANEEIGSKIQILESTRSGQHIVSAGTEIEKGETIFHSGEAITANMIAPLASFGYSRVKVGSMPRVAILGTGSEIVEIEETPGRDQIRNSNSVMLEVLAKRVGATTKILPNAKDDLAALKAQIEAAAADSDVLILTGGVSVGKYDLTKAAIGELGAEIFFERVRLKPGKPAVFARLNDTLVFALPGNPVSAAVTFHLFVRPSLLILQGAKSFEPRTGHAIASGDVRAARERDTYLPARLTSDTSGHLIAEQLKWHGSSDFVGFSQAEALILVDRGTTVNSGEVVRIEYL